MAQRSELKWFMSFDQMVALPAASKPKRVWVTARDRGQVCQSVQDCVEKLKWSDLGPRPKGYQNICRTE